MSATSGISPGGDVAGCGDYGCRCDPCAAARAGVHRVEIRLCPTGGAGGGPGGSLVVGGTDLSDAVRGFTLKLDAGHMPVLTVDLATWEHEVGGEMSVTVPDRARAALVKLGWTPPEG